MVKKATKKSGKAIDRKAMKKTKGGIIIQGGMTSPTALNGGTITGNFNGDGRTINGGGFTGGI